MNATVLKPIHISAWTNVIILLGNLGMLGLLALSFSSVMKLHNSVLIIAPLLIIILNW